MKENVSPVCEKCFGAHKTSQHDSLIKKKEKNIEEKQISFLKKNESLKNFKE